MHRIAGSCRSLSKNTLSLLTMAPRLRTLAKPHMSVIFFFVESVCQDPGNDVLILNANDDSGIANATIANFNVEIIRLAIT